MELKKSTVYNTDYGTTVVAADPVTAQTIDLSVIIPALDEADNLSYLLPALHKTLSRLNIRFEIIIVDKAPKPATADVAQQYNAILIDQAQTGYGNATKAGIAVAQGAYILTMDADLSHPPNYITDMWNQRQQADIVIASRYVPGAKYKMPALRAILSRILNTVFSRGLSLLVRDMSSGYRLYNAAVLKSLNFQNEDFSILQEILVSAYCEGRSICEVPFNYLPRNHGASHARVIKFGISYLKTFWSLYRLRNSILSADYDDRAYTSFVIPQRYWQQQRFRHIVELLQGEGTVLDVGCGSSRIIGALPEGSIALDILLRKLRYDRKFNRHLVHGSGFDLPFPDESFPCVICSQVIEHVPKTSTILKELIRVLKPGGTLILGTPDYANWEWNLIEAIYAKVLPSAYADEHISHYTRQELVDMYESQGYVVEDTRYILRGELILKLRKPKDNVKSNL